MDRISGSGLQTPARENKDSETASDQEEKATPEKSGRRVSQSKTKVKQLARSPASSVFATGEEPDRIVTTSPASQKVLTSGASQSSGAAFVPGESLMATSRLENSGDGGKLILDEMLSRACNKPEWLETSTRLNVQYLDEEGKLVSFDYQTGAGIAPGYVRSGQEIESTKDYSSLSFGQLLVKVMAIPLDQYIVFDQEVLRKMKANVMSHFNNFDKVSKEKKILRESFAAISIGKDVFLAIHALITQKFGAREHEKKELVKKLFERARETHEEKTKYALRTILARYRLKIYLAAEDRGEVDISDILMLLGSTKNLDPTINLIGQKFYYFSGAYPGYQKRANVFRMGELLSKIQFINRLNFPTNIACFSLSDCLLLTKFNDESKMALLKEAHVTPPPLMIMRLVLYMAQYSGGPIRLCRELHYFNCKAGNNNPYIVDVAINIFSAFHFCSDGGKRTDRFNPLETEVVKTGLINCKIDGCPEACSEWIEGLGYALVALLSIRELYHASRSLRRGIRLKVAVNFCEAAKRGLVFHWGSAAIYYDKARIWKQAVIAAKKMAESSDDELDRLHWEAMAEKYQSSCEQQRPAMNVSVAEPDCAEPAPAKEKKKTKPKKGKSQNVVFPEAVMRKEETPCAPVKPKHTSLKSIETVQSISHTDRLERGKHTSIVLHEFDVVYNFVGRSKSNIEDIGRTVNPEEAAEWKTVSHNKKAIESHEIHLKRNRNPNIAITIRNINLARDDQDFQSEMDHISRLINMPNSSSFIGIERFYEEAAWSLFRIFADLYNSEELFREVKSSTIERKYEILKVGKILLLASLSRRLNMDTLNANITFEEIRKLVEKHVDIYRSIDTEICKETIHNLRCLMSSMGHYYNFSLMLSGLDNLRLKENAIKFYNFKKYLVEQSLHL